MEVSTVISFLAVLGGGLGVWVRANQKISVLEHRVETLEEQFSEHREAYNTYTEATRKEMGERMDKIFDELHKLGLQIANLTGKIESK